MPGKQYDTRECYNKSLELSKKERKLPQMMEVGKVSEGPMETNVDLRLKEKESTSGLIKELVEIQVDPKKRAELSSLTSV